LGLPDGVFASITIWSRIRAGPAVFRIPRAVDTVEMFLRMFSECFSRDGSSVTYHTFSTMPSADSSPATNSSRWSRRSVLWMADPSSSTLIYGNGSREITCESNGSRRPSMRHTCPQAAWGLTHVFPSKNGEALLRMCWLEDAYSEFRPGRRASFLPGKSAFFYYLAQFFFFFIMPHSPAGPRVCAARIWHGRLSKAGGTDPDRYGFLQQHRLFSFDGLLEKLNVTKAIVLGVGLTVAGRSRWDWPRRHPSKCDARHRFFSNASYAREDIGSEMEHQRAASSSACVAPKRRIWC